MRQKDRERERGKRREGRVKRECELAAWEANCVFKHFPNRSFTESPTAAAPAIETTNAVH